MYSNKPHINIITGMLGAYGVKHIVVCPGSRNAPLVHNFHQAATSLAFKLHPVTDERSAAFVAVGIAAQTKTCVAVCVTSGSAVLCCAPAIAEAYYRQLPILIISADRPKEWIDQLDGQTIHQTKALEPYAKCYDIEEAPLDIDKQTQLLHQAFGKLLHDRLPIQINVQISEPLFQFTENSQPTITVQPLQSPNALEYCSLPSQVVALLKDAKRPLLVMGQTNEYHPEYFPEIAKRIACLPEIIANAPNTTWAAVAEKHLLERGTLDYQPDVVVHLGGALIHKQLKLFLRKTTALKVVRIDAQTYEADTFCHITHSVKMPTSQALKCLANLPFRKSAHVELINSLKSTLQDTPYNLSFEQTAVNLLGQHLVQLKPKISALHLANSMSVRLASRFIEGGHFPIFCNRGTNGIEGSLSAAVGSALCCRNMVVLIIGDLSFFYDVNALWNVNLKGNLRILLLNNNKGQIFHQLPGITSSPALNHYISAQHTATAQGVCQSFNCNHRSITSASELDEALNWLLLHDFQRPAILELITHPE